MQSNKDLDQHWEFTLLPDNKTALLNASKKIVNDKAIQYLNHNKSTLKSFLIKQDSIAHLQERLDSTQYVNKIKELGALADQKHVNTASINS